MPIRPDRAAELRRIFGVDVVVTETSRTDARHVGGLTASMQADAVLLDVVEPVALGVLVSHIGSYVLLRPLTRYVRTSRGEPQPVFRHTAGSQHRAVSSASRTER